MNIVVLSLLYEENLNLMLFLSSSKMKQKTVDETIPPSAICLHLKSEFFVWSLNEFNWLGDTLNFKVNMWAIN